MLTGKGTGQNPADRIRNQALLYTRADVGKKVVVITNLKPTKLAGVLSEGMLLRAEDFDGNLALLTAEKDMPAGAMIS